MAYRYGVYSQGGFSRRKGLLDSLGFAGAGSNSYARNKLYFAISISMNNLLMLSHMPLPLYLI